MLSTRSVTNWVNQIVLPPMNSVRVSPPGRFGGLLRCGTAGTQALIKLSYITELRWINLDMGADSLGNPVFFSNASYNKAPMRRLYHNSGKPRPRAVFTNSLYHLTGF